MADAFGDEGHGPRGGRHPRGGLTTTGVGAVQAVPDIAVVRLAAQCTDEDAPTALATAAAASGAMVDVLLTAGVARRDIRTTATTSWTDPGQVEDGPGESRTVRRPRTTVSLGVEVTLRDTATAGELAARAVGAAGPAGRLDGTTFRVGDPVPAARRARELAFAQAVAAAEQLAALAGRALGPVLDVREESDGGPVAATFMATRAMARDVPLEAGEQEVRVRLTVRHAWAAAPGTD
ncbi:MAG TPA: SIMPL domain-containing protein [Actinotalea sp.]|nr:SIMPL domain-containing protein [Actinotalea sp.]